MATIANLFVKIGADTSEFEKKMKSVSANLQTAGQQMASVGKSLAMGLTAPIAGVAAASFKMASDMSESVNKVDVAFGENAGQIKDWSKTTLESFGLAKGTALDMAAGFGDMATSMGFSTAGASAMSTSLVGLAGDLASFKNIGIGEATTALTAIFTGETESLKKMGIVMTQANLTAFAMSQGIQTNIADMTQAEQVQLRYNYVMEMTKNAQGDFARTSDGAANQMRIFTESLKETGAELGSQLLPIITPMIAKVNEWIKAFAALDEGTKRNILIIGGLVAAIGPAMMIIGGLTSGIGSLINGVSLASKALGAGQGLMGALSALMGPAGLALLAISAIAAIAFVVIKNWEPIKAFFTNMFTSISNEFEAFKTGFLNGWQSLKDGVSQIYRSLVNSVISAINGMIRGLNRIQMNVPSWVPMIGGKNFGFNIPEIPAYAQGTPYVPQTGLALLHKGEAVIPAAQNRGGGQSVNVIVELDSRTLLKALGQPLADTIRLKSFGGDVGGGALKITIGERIDSWEQVAPQSGTQTYILSMAVFNGKIYAGTYPNGQLLEWNGTNAWVLRAGQLASQTFIRSLCVFNGKLYGSTSPNARLFEWNGTDAWVAVASDPLFSDGIYALAEHNGKLYGGGDLFGYLYEWNGTNAWVAKAGCLASSFVITSLISFNGKLYGGTYNDGRLLEWNGTDAWVEVAPTLNGQTWIYSMAELNGKLYAGTYPNAKLFQWNGTNAWVEVATQLNSASYVYRVLAYNGSIYASNSNGDFLRWNGTDAWVKLSFVEAEDRAFLAMIVFDGKIYGGESPTGKLYVGGSGGVTVLLDSIQIEDAIGERTTCSFVVIDEEGTETFSQSQPVEVTDDGVTLFAGFIERAVSKKARGNSAILHSIDCKDMHYLSDKRVVAKAYENTAAGTIVSDLIADYLIDEGVTEGTIQAGPTLVEAIFNYVSATKALESLAEKAGFIWYIDYDRKLYFMARETVVAPWTATADEMLEGTVTVENGNSAYRNTQFVRGGKDITDTLTETRIGDGVATAFTVGFPIALVPTVTLNAGAQTVGIRGVDTGKDWYWSKGSNILSQDTAGTVLISTDTLVIAYKGEFDVIVKTLNEEEIARLINAEASSGIVENVADENNSTTREAAFEVANSKLQKYGVTGRRLRFSTLDSGLFAGQILTVDLPEHDIDTDLLIESVSTVTEQGTPIYEVTASEGPEQQSWQMLFANLATRNINQSIFENISEEEVLITLSTFTKTWLEAESPNIFTENYPSDTLQPSATTQPSFELDERVLYVELLDGSDVVLFRQPIIKQLVTTTLNSINYVAPYEAIGTIAKIRWYGGSTATSVNGTGTLVDEQSYSNVKTSIEAVQLDKTDTKWV